jgi:hypothetical protein
MGLFLSIFMKQIISIRVYTSPFSGIGKDKRASFHFFLEDWVETSKEFCFWIELMEPPRFSSVNVVKEIWYSFSYCSEDASWHFWLALLAASFSLLKLLLNVAFRDSLIASCIFDCSTFVNLSNILIQGINLRMSFSDPDLNVARTSVNTTERSPAIISESHNLKSESLRLLSIVDGSLLVILIRLLHFSTAKTIWHVACK